MRILIAILLLSFSAAAQTISPASPSAGVNTVVTVSTLPSAESTYMIAYPSGIPVGGDVRLMLVWGGNGENSGSEMTQVVWNKFVSVGYNAVSGTPNPGPWNMKQRKSDGSYIYWCIMGIPAYGNTPVTNQAKAIDAVINFFATKGLDTANATNFYSMQLSAGTRQFWCYRGNKSTEVVSYTSKHYYKFNRTLTMSPISISTSINADINAITAATPGRHAVFYDINDATTTLIDAYSMYNKLNAASARRKDSTAGTGTTHAGKTWDSAASYINFDKIPATGVRTPTSNIVTWLAEPDAASNQPPIVNAGVNEVITLPTNTVSLSAAANDPDGYIASLLWTKISGPSGGTISTPTLGTTNITALQQGVYVYRMTVTDNLGLQSFDEVQVTVNAAPINTIIVYGRNPTIQ